MKMMKGFLLMLVCLTVAAGAVFANGSAEGSDTPEAAEAAVWPAGPINLIVTSRAGGFADFHTRVLGDYIQETTGTPVAVLNATEGGGSVGSDTVAKADPDGLTLLYMHTSFPISCYTGRTDLDPVSDFTSIRSVVNAGNNALVVRADAPWDNLEELVEDARKRPDEIVWGAMAGATSHFMLAMLEQEAGVDFKMVDAGSESEKITMLLGGHLDVCNISMRNLDQYVKAGQMKNMGVMGSERDFAFPEYSTTGEQGYDVVWNGEFMLWGPAGMPDEMVAQINDVLEGYGTTDQKSADAIAGHGGWVVERTAEESIAFMYDTYEEFEALAKELGF